MQENNSEPNNNPSETTKKEPKNEKKKTGSFFSEHKAEFKKITWPTKKILVKQTITVIFISIIVGVIIYGYDFIINFIFQKLISL
ncbi:MAG: preprotein translocase subunit SecE [Eubacteriales bacterium]|nr:preprotein translocase subunit SecE [Eubacteriales bacterium]